MSHTNQLVLLANYNQLMNQRQYDAASELSKAQLCEDRGAFFKSAIGTLNHILVGDLVWLKRFSEHPSSAQTLSPIRDMATPTNLDSVLFTDLAELKVQREKIDELMIDWVKELTQDDLAQCINYKNMAGKTFNKPLLSLVNHLFLHQVHHRGQVATLLSQFGVDFGETDLVEIIDECDV